VFTFYIVNYVPGGLSDVREVPRTGKQDRAAKEIDGLDQRQLTIDRLNQLIKQMAAEKAALHLDPN
jgi:hypothetical protein